MIQLLVLNTDLKLGFIVLLVLKIHWIVSQCNKPEKIRRKENIASATITLVELKVSMDTFGIRIKYSFHRVLSGCPIHREVLVWM